MPLIKLRVILSPFKCIPITLKLNRCGAAEDCGLLSLFCNSIAAHFTTLLKCRTAIFCMDKVHFEFLKCASVHYFSDGPNSRSHNHLAIIRQSCYIVKQGLVKIVVRGNLLSELFQRYQGVVKLIAATIKKPHGIHVCVVLCTQP